MYVDIDILRLKCIPEIKKSKKFLNDALDTNKKIAEIGKRYGRGIYEINNDVKETINYVIDTMDMLILYINEKIELFNLAGVRNNDLKELRLANDLKELRLANVKSFKVKKNEMPLEECLKLAIEEYNKNGKSNKFYEILSLNHDWFWYETLDGKIVRPESSQYEYYKSIDEYMTLKTSKEFLELLDEVSGGEYKEYENDRGYSIYNIINIEYMYKDYDNRCNEFYKTNFGGLYGTDQGIFDRSEKSFEKATDYLTHAYGMNIADAYNTLEALDSIGACSYADVVNQIIYAYKDNQAEFQQKFGFPMYDAKDGQLNDELLLVDLYVFTNRDVSFDIKRKINKKTVSLKEDNFYFEREENEVKAKVKKQYYLSWDEEGIEINRVNKYLMSKYTSGVNFQFDETLFDIDETKELSNRQIKNIIENSIQAGNSIGVGIYPNEENPTYFKGLGNEDGVCKGGHAVTVTDAIEEGIVISSWGNKYVITYDELRKNNFYISVLSKKNSYGILGGKGKNE